MNASFRSIQSSRNVVRCHDVGAASKQMVMAIALIVVIGVCAVFMWGQLFGGDKGGGDRISNLGYQCQVCDHQFVITNIQLREQIQDNASLNKDPTRAIDQAHCPKCGEKHAGIPMFECPKCATFFLPAKINLRTNPDAVMPPAICPECKTNLTEWMRTH